MNEITSKNNTMKIAIIILSILLIGCVGFVAYDKLIKKENPITDIVGVYQATKLIEVPSTTSPEEGEIVEIYKNEGKSKIEFFEDGTFKINDGIHNWQFEVIGEGTYKLENGKLKLSNISLSYNESSAFFGQEYNIIRESEYADMGYSLTSLEYNVEYKNNGFKLGDIEFTKK